MTFEEALAQIEVAVREHGATVDPRNPRRHSRAQIRAIARSIEASPQRPASATADEVISGAFWCSALGRNWHLADISRQACAYPLSERTGQAASGGSLPIRRG